MLRRKSGSIAAVSSSLSKRSNEGFLAQARPRLRWTLLRALAAELGPVGVRVNTVAPGLTLTDAAHADVACREGEDRLQLPHAPQRLPEDMAGAVLFLASDSVAVHDRHLRACRWRVHDVVAARRCLHLAKLGARA